MGQLDTLLGKQNKTQTASSGGNLDSLLKSGIKITPTTTPIYQQPIVRKGESQQSPKTIFSSIQNAVKIALERGSGAKAKVSNQELSKREGLGGPIGRTLQKIPNADLGTKISKAFPALEATDTETKIVDFISNFPSSIAQSWGQTMEQLSSQDGRDKLKADAKDLPKTISEIRTHIEAKDWQKAFETAMSNSAFTVALDVTDFIPVTALAKKGITSGFKSVFKQGAKESVEQIVKEIPAETRKVAQTIVKEALEESEKELKTVKPLKSETIKPKATVELKSKEVSDPLTQEARKYKSAEEFVKGQGETVFRGGGKYDPSKVGQDGIALTADAKRAKFFTAKTQGKGGEKGRFVQDFVIDKNAKIASKDDVPSKLWETIEPDDIAKWAKVNGYDAVDLRKLGGSIAQADKEIRVFNPDVLKTKSQLTDIWNKANKVKTKEIKVKPKEVKVVYNASSPENFAKIQKEGFNSKSGNVFFSDMHKVGYGSSATKMDLSKLNLLDNTSKDAKEYIEQFGDIGIHLPNPESQKFLADKGYDGIKFNRFDDNTPEYIVTNQPKLNSLLKEQKLALLQAGKVKEVKVPREQLPQGQSKVFARLQKDYPEQLKGELPYDQAVLKTEFDKATSRIAKNKQDAYEVAMGRKDVLDIESVTTNIEMAERALEEGNNALYEKLVRSRSIAQTRRGQAIVAEKASIEDNSTARYVKDLISARLDVLGKRYLSGLKEGTTIKKHATEIIDRKVGQLEINIKKGKIDTKTALKLLDELTCV